MKPQDTAPGVGKHSDSQSWLSGPQTCKEAGPFGSQILGNPGATESCGRPEKGLGTHGVDLAQGLLWLGPTGRRVLD